MSDAPDDLAALYRNTLKLVGDDREFARLGQRLDTFSPFDALGVADYEIRHGNFLAYLLNPNASHGFGEKVLLAFLKQLLVTGDDTKKLGQIIVGGVGQTLVRREWHDIDIVIELQNPDLRTVIVVELKLNANESPHQLAKYEKFVSERAEYDSVDKIFVFATPEGAEASLEGWRDFNMTAGFVQALRDIVSQGIGDPIARGLLADYVRIMERKFMTDKELDDLAEKLWARYPDVHGFLADNRPDLVGRVFDSLSELGNEDMSKLVEQGFDFRKDWDHETNSRLLYTFDNWDDFPGMLTSTDKRMAVSGRLIWLELLKSQDGIRAMFIIGPGDPDARRELLRILIEAGVETGKQKTIDEMAKNFSTLASTWLLHDKAGQYTWEDLEKLTVKAKKNLEDFLVTHVPQLDSAIKGYQSN